MRKHLSILIMFLTLVSVSYQASFAQNEPYVLSHFSAKGTVTENNPFGGIVFWTIVNGEEGTIVTSFEDGIRVIRLAMEQSDSCPDLPDTVCLDAIVTSAKNTLLTKVADDAKIVFEMPHKQTITILSGELETLEIVVNLEKIKVKDVEKIIEQDVQNQSQQELTQEAFSKLQDALVLTKHPDIQQTLKDSNNEFGELADPYALVDERDDEWVSSDDQLTPFMGTLLGNKASELLREIMNEDKAQTKDYVYEEIILTNVYGANVALTAKTTDYKQWDEQWWQLAKDTGVNFETGYDESAGVESLDMSVRISDDDGRFMGVMKFVINAEKVTEE